MRREHGGGWGGGGGYAPCLTAKQPLSGMQFLQVLMAVHVLTSAA
jgi:hypothetical protein